ncbi:MAG: hypothetical protein Q7T71_00120 [Herbiconiux sp.]|nr:hypothetical protein [Herbiconiux sp.]
MSFLGGNKKDPFEPGKTERENKASQSDDDDPRKPSSTRVAIWIIVSAVGLYFIGSGVWGILTQQ